MGKQLFAEPLGIKPPSRQQRLHRRIWSREILPFSSPENEGLNAIGRHPGNKWPQKASLSRALAARMLTEKYMQDFNAQKNFLTKEEKDKLAAKTVGAAFTTVSYFNEAARSGRFAGALFRQARGRAYYALYKAFAHCLGTPFGTMEPLDVAIRLASPKDRQEWLLERGAIYFRHWQYNEAIADYERALSIKGELDSSVIRLLLGVCHVQSCSLQKGASIIEEAFSAKLKDKKMAGDAYLPFLKALQTLSERGLTGKAEELMARWHGWKP